MGTRARVRSGLTWWTEGMLSFQACCLRIVGGRGEAASQSDEAMTTLAARYSSRTRAYRIWSARRTEIFHRVFQTAEADNQSRARPAVEKSGPGGFFGLYSRTEYRSRILRSVQIEGPHNFVLYCVAQNKLLSRPPQREAIIEAQATSSTASMRLQYLGTVAP